MGNRFQQTVIIVIASLFLLISILICARTVPGQSGRSPKRGESPTINAPKSETSPTPDAKRSERSKLLLLVADYIPSPNVTIETGWVYQSFLERLAQSPLVTVNALNEMRRKDAIEQAKQHKEGFVIWLHLEIDPGPRDLEKDPETASISPINSACLFVTYEMFAAITGKPIALDHVMQQGDQPSRCIGGVYHPSPLPDGPSRARRPPEDTLKEAGRNTGDRVLSLLNLPAPSKHP